MSKRRKTRGNTKQEGRTLLTISGGAALTLGAALSPSLDAATFNVTNLNDGGAGSLRQAIVDANGAAGADVVAFQTGLTGTITLTTGQLEVTDSVDIQGPGPAALTVSGNNTSRIFYVYNATALIDVTISGLTITQGNAPNGGGVYLSDQHLTLDDVVITSNTASGDGGGVWADGFDMTLTIRDSSITGNAAGADGGGIYTEDTDTPSPSSTSAILIENTVISGNTAADDGGGIYFYDADGAVTVEDCTISGNTAGHIGGGVYFYHNDVGLFTVRSTTISGNTAAEGGGAFLFRPSQGGRIENSTISGNRATSGDGGGIYILEGRSLFSANHITVASNSASVSGGGIIVGKGTLFGSDGTLPLNNSIVADNSAAGGPDLAVRPNGSFNASYSLIEDPSGATINYLTGNITLQDPQLAPLANNGGPTQTQKPAFASPAVNAGNPAFAPPPSVDQRGFPRVALGQIDMGAVEFNPGTVQFTVNALAANETDPPLTFTVTRDGGIDGPISVDYASANGTAGAPGDFVAAAGTLSWADLDGASKSFNVTLVSDLVLEPQEAFAVSLSNPVVTTIGTNGSVDVTIAASPGPPSLVGFALTVVSVDESAGTVTLAVQRTGSSSGAISVDYLAVAGTALLPDDFSSAAGTLNWADGDATDKLIQVTLAQDGLTEPAETFTVVLSNPVNATLGNNTVSTVTINANRGPNGVEVPTLGWWAKLAMMLGTAFAGLWALGRRMLAVMLFSLVAAGVAYDASAAATPSKGKSAKAAQIKSVSSPAAGTVSLALSDGSIVTFPADKLKVTDQRATSKGKGGGKANSLDGIAADQPVVVKVRTDPDGNVMKVSVKLYDTLEKANAGLEAKD